MQKLRVIFLFLLLPNLIYANFKFEVSPDKVSMNNRNNHEEIDKLTKKLQILEARINYLEKIVLNNNHPTYQTQNTSKWSCFLQNNFGETFSGSGQNKAEASSNALKQCSGQLSCKREKLTCSN